MDILATSAIVTNPVLVDVDVDADDELDDVPEVPAELLVELESEPLDCPTVPLTATTSPPIGAVSFASLTFCWSCVTSAFWLVTFSSAESTAD
jgi:hypothetical protein